MLRTIAIKLTTTPEQEERIKHLGIQYARACNIAVSYAVSYRCWNRVQLHHYAYYPIREAISLGSQMCCNAVKSVCSKYKVLKIKRNQDVPEIKFKPKSIHYDKKTYSVKNGVLSLYTIPGRIKVPMILGKQQSKWLEKGEPKEADLVCKKGTWYFHLVVEIEDTLQSSSGNAYGIDLGENNIVAASTGMIVSGKELRHKRDRHLHLRKRLQSKGTRSAKQLLRKISGKEARHMKHVNHCISKLIVEDAVKSGAGIIVLENLKNIRKRIKYGKRLNTRLHRWAFAQLQDFIIYKAEEAGLRVEKRNPAYSSQFCSICGCQGFREKHKFSCPECESVQHSDVNASKNLAQIAVSKGAVTGLVNGPYVPYRLSVG